MSAIEDSLAAAAEQGAKRALVGHLPRLILSRRDVAEMLNVSVGTVDAMVADGTLATLVRGKILLSSVLRAAGWPVVPAPVGAPLTVVGAA